jgi:hypothetical protein
MPSENNGTAPRPSWADYFWRVRAGDGYEYAERSPLASFVIGRGYICGDANADRVMTVGDAVHAVNYIFRGGPAPASMAAANANGDRKITVGDAIFIIAYIFREGPSPICSPI